MTSTTWRIVNLIGTGYTNTNVRLSIDTTSTVMVAAIERAAAAAGIVLEREVTP